MKTVYQDIEHYRSHNLSDEEILNNLKLKVKSMVYENQTINYYFIIGFDGTQLVNPLYPTLEGKNNLKSTSPETQSNIDTLKEEAIKNNGTFMTYKYYSKDLKEITTKVSYIVPLNEFEIFIGTGIFLNEIHSQIRAFTRNAIGISLIFIIITIMVIFLIFAPILNVNNELFYSLKKISEYPDSFSEIPLKKYRKGSDSHFIADSFNKMAKSIIDSTQFTNLLLNTIPDIVIVLNNNFELIRKNREIENTTIISEIVANIKNNTFEEKIINIFPEKSYKIQVEPFYSESKLFYTVVITDITKTLQYEYKLIESEEKYRLFFENNIDAVFITDKNGKFKILNRPGIELFGENSIDNKKIFDFIINEKDKMKIINNINHGIPLYYFQTSLNTINNNILNIDITMYELKDNSNNEIYYQGFIRDISEIKELQKKLIQNQKLEAIGQLAGGIAHDFNNLLTVVLGNSDLILLDISPDSEIYEEIIEIKESAERGSKLTSQLLAFSKKQIIHPEIINLNDIIKNTYKLLKRLIGENIDLYINLSNDLMPIKGDKGQIEQIIINLCVNSRDALNSQNTKFKKRISISTKNDSENKVSLIILDNGPGIEEQNRSKVFDPFFTTKPMDKGTGLGLSTVFGITQKHNAQILLNSQTGDDSFTEFTIQWSAEEFSEISYQETYSQKIDLPYYNILLIEDEVSLRKFTFNALSKYGHNVIDASTIEEAKSCLNGKNKFDIMFCDIILPDGNGVDFTKTVAAEHPEISIILTSGYPDDYLKNMNFDEQSFSFLRKPYSINELNQILYKIRNN